MRKVYSLCVIKLMNYEGSSLSSVNVKADQASHKVRSNVALQALKILTKMLIISSLIQESPY